MKNKILLRKFQNLTLLFTYLLCTVFMAVQGFFIASASEVYSNVVEDLKKDSSFSLEDYSSNDEDYSLKVITIAESTDKQLLVYVYQASALTKPLTATSINISVGEELDVHNYTLSLQSRDGVFAKYAVDDFVVSEEPKRIYDIVSIFRAFDETIDEQTGNDNTVNEVVYPVAKRYTFSVDEETGLPVNSCIEFETVVIHPEDKYVGFVRFRGGATLGSVNNGDSHFIAFKTEQPIDKLKSVKILYTSQAYTDYVTVNSITGYQGHGISYGTKVNQEVLIDETQLGTWTGDGWFAPTYNFKRISTVDEFLTNPGSGIYNGVVLDANAGINITNSASEILKDKEWIIRFAETGYSSTTRLDGWTVNSTLISNVTVLQLEFEVDGVIYNLGVVDNKATTGNKPINTTVWSYWLNIGGWVLLAFIVIVILIFFAPSVIKFLIKAIWWLLCLPFRLIALPFKKK